MIVGFTGSRAGVSSDQISKIRDFLDSNEVSEVHHGDCVGADSSFHDVCLEYDVNIIIHPPDNDYLRSFCKGNFKHDPKPYLDRNRDIVDSCDVLIACPINLEEERRSGTWSTVRYARKLFKLIVIIPKSP